jgi:hypothetical protein
VVSGKLLVAIALVVIGIALIPQVKKNGVVAMGWVLGFVATGLAIVVAFALMQR